MITIILKPKREAAGEGRTDPDAIGLWILQLICEILPVLRGLFALVLASHAISRDSKSRSV